MGSLRVQLVDRNRYSKRYPVIRSPVRLTYMGDTDLAMEMGSIYFDNAESGTLNFEASFPDTNYQVSAVARDANVDSGNVNVFVSAKTVSSVTVQASSNFTGYVDVFVVRTP